jgi:hypothetical protein
MATVMLKKIGDFPDTVKVSPQLKVIMEAMAKYENGVDRAALGKEVEADLKTRQDPVRVIMFYQSKMVEHNVVEVTKIGVEKAPKAEGEKAPKKSKKAAQTETVAA